MNASHVCRNGGLSQTDYTSKEFGENGDSLDGVEEADELLMAMALNYYLNNTVKTHALLQAAVRGNVKYFVFSSSAAVYGNPSFTPVSETADPAPLSP
jgi:hypothetical protein